MAVVSRGLLSLAIIITIVLATIMYLIWGAKGWSAGMIGGFYAAFQAGKIFRDYWRSKSCLTISDIASRTGIPEPQLNKMLAAKKIMPRYLVQTARKEFTNKYALDDLGEMMTLLRASEHPQNDATLLRATQENPTSPQMLLRPIQFEAIEMERSEIERPDQERTETVPTELKPAEYTAVIQEEAHPLLQN